MAIKKNTGSVDILQQKQIKLNDCVTRFNNAVSLVTNTIGSLDEINRDITNTIQEIEDYQRELETTRAGLDDARTKNERVIANFRALLSAD